MLRSHTMIPCMLTAAATVLCLASGGHAQVGGPQGYEGFGSYGEFAPPKYVHPRHRIGHGHHWCGSYRNPHHSYGKYLFHVKYKYPELNYGIRHSPSSFYGYAQPVIIFPVAPEAVQAPAPQIDESAIDSQTTPSPEMMQRFLQLAKASPDVVVIEAAAKSTPVIDLEKRPMTTEGWNLIREGDSTGAWRALSIDAMNDPFNSVPRIGYAIAQSMRGDAGQSVWSMRRAIRLDPSAIISVEADEELADRINSLREQWMEATVDAENPADAPFMIAVLSFMLGETRQAEQALDDAIAAGDQSESVRNLSAVFRTVRERNATRQFVLATAFLH